MTLLNLVHDKFTFTPLEWMLIGAAVLFFLIGVSFIAAVFISRVRKSDIADREQKLKRQFQQILNALIINESCSPHNPQSVFEFRMAEFRAIIGNSDFARQILIDQILKLKKSLTGNTIRVLMETYCSLDLQQMSMRKLRSPAWQKKARGIRELTEMECHESITLIRKYINSSHQTLRQESVMALVRLDRENPLSFLWSYHGAINLWMSINIHHYLKKLDIRKLPLFSPWLMHENRDVRIFSLNMVRQFRQTSAIPDLIKLFHHSDKRTAALAVDIIGDLEAFEQREHVARLAAAQLNDTELTIQVIRCLGNIGDPVVDGEILLTFLDDPNYDVRFEAARSLKKLGEDNASIVAASSSPETMGHVVAHLEEPLLQ